MTYYKSIRLPFDRMSDLIGRHPYFILIAISIITIFFVWHIPSLSFRTTIYDLVVEGLDEARRYEEFQEEFGSEEIIRIVVITKNVFDPIVFRKVEQISELSSKIDGVRRVISLPNIKKAMEKGKEWSLEEFSTMMKPIDLFKRNLISIDHKTTSITLVLNIDSDKEAVVEGVEELISNTSDSLSLYQIGMPNVSKALAEYTRKDFLSLPPFTLILVAVILFLLFRNLNCLILPISCVLLSLVWTFGLMALAGVSLSILTMVVPVFLIAVGTAYCIHVCSEYMTSARISPTAGETMRSTLRKVSLPVVLATITTVIGIGSLMINRIDAIREFALFTCFGMLSLMVLILTFFPVMLQLLPMPRKNGTGFRPIERFFNGILEQVVRMNLFHQKACLIIIGLITLFCGIGIFFIQVETNPVGFFKKDTQISREFHDIYKDLSGSFPINIVMAGNTQDYFEKPEHILDIVRVQEYCETLPGIDKTVSFADYLMLVNYVNNQYDPSYYALPSKPYQLRILINNFKSLLGEDVFSSFMNSGFSHTNILMLSHVSSSRDFLAIKEGILDYVKENFSKGLLWDVTGFGIVISASSQFLTSGQIKSLVVSLSLIFCIMVMLFLSGKVGILAMVPNFFPIIVNFGLIGWLGLELSIVTSLIACIAIGLAVDDSIHYLVRYNSEFRKDLDKDRALRDTIMSVGRPIIFSSVTIGLGFSILIFSHFQPTSIFGILMIVTMLSALVGDLILLPALMRRVELVTAWDLLKLMPVLGGMTPGVVHELNQPLNAIKIGSEFLKMLTRQGARIREDQLSQVTSEISTQVDRASEIINRLSKAGEKPTLNRGEVMVSHVLKGTLAMFGDQLKLDNIELELDLDDTLPPVWANYNRLVQVVFNLISNARDAINEQRGMQKEQAPNIIRIRSFGHKGNVAVSVFDSGPGIARNIKERIFEPFFTTREQGKGRGLGLSISREIIREYGGRLRVDSKIDEGTTVTMTFPS